MKLAAIPAICFSHKSAAASLYTEMSEDYTPSGANERIDATSGMKFSSDDTDLNGDGRKSSSIPTVSSSGRDFRSTNRRKGVDANHLLSFQFHRSTTNKSVPLVSTTPSKSNNRNNRPRASSLSQGHFLQAK